jgi:Periplasmic binding protein
MRPRRYALALALVLALGACGGGKKVNEAGPGATAAPAATSTGKDVCKGVTLQASDVGITPTTITITVAADIGSSIRPGLFLGSINAVKGWAAAQNKLGGLACRQVVVKAADSKLSPDDTKNALTAACGDSFALVGTTALFLNDVTPMEQCKDKAGAVTGLPDLAVLQTESAQQCSRVSFAMLPSGASCPYSGSGPRTFPYINTPVEYYFSKYGKNSLHGIYVVPKDLPSTIAASIPLFRAAQQLGIKSDGEFGASGLAVQSDYTPFVIQMKKANSTFAQVGLDYKGTVYLRKEAAAQGVSTVKVWHCTTQCYDSRLITEGQSAVEGQYVWINVLPFEDRGSNATLDAYLNAVSKPDSFGAQAWMAGEMFKKAVNDVVEKSGPNGLTRAALLDAIRNTHDFDAGGMAPKTDIGGKKGSPCVVGLQVKNGKFVRVDPVDKGKFDCSGKPYSITLDPNTAFKG